MPMIYHCTKCGQMHLQDGAECKAVFYVCNQCGKNHLENTRPLLCEHMAILARAVLSTEGWHWCSSDDRIALERMERTDEEASDD